MTRHLKIHFKPGTINQLARLTPVDPAQVKQLRANRDRAVGVIASPLRRWWGGLTNRWNYVVIETDKSDEELRQIFYE